MVANHSSSELLNKKKIEIEFTYQIIGDEANCQRSYTL